MIIFYDFLYQQAELCSDAYEHKLLADGAVMAIEARKVQEGGESVDIGANASKEEAEEGIEDEVKTVINVSHNKLSQVRLEKKEYTALQNGYWNQLKNGIEKQQNILLFGSEEKIPEQKSAEQKEEFKKLKTAAEAKLKGVAKTEYDALKARFAAFKTHFPALQKFVKDEILANFTDFDFYKADSDNAVLGQTMIIPARYIGEAVSPTFYFFVDGLHGEKA